MHAPPPQKPDFNKRVEQFVKLRDHIRKLDDAHSETMKPLRETLEQLNGVLLNHLNEIGGESVRTESGTVYRTEKKSASIVDKTAFWTYVSVNGDWDLLDYKPNVTAVADHIQKQVEAAQADPSIVPAPPPGVNYSVRYVVGVRRS